MEPSLGGSAPLLHKVEKLLPEVFPPLSNTTEKQSLQPPAIEALLINESPGAVWGSAPNSPRAFSTFLQLRIASLYEKNECPPISQLYGYGGIPTALKETPLDVAPLDVAPVDLETDSTETGGSNGWDFLKHFTISRDQTQHSTFVQEQLLALIIGPSVLSANLSSNSNAGDDKAKESAPPISGELFSRKKAEEEVVGRHNKGAESESFTSRAPQIQIATREPRLFSSLRRRSSSSSSSASSATGSEFLSTLTPLNTTHTHVTIPTNPRLETLDKRTISLRTYLSSSNYSSVAGSSRTSSHSSLGFEDIEDRQSNLSEQASESEDSVLLDTGIDLGDLLLDTIKTYDQPPLPVTSPDSLDHKPKSSEQELYRHGIGRPSSSNSTYTDERVYYSDRSEDSISQNQLELGFDQQKMLRHSEPEGVSSRQERYSQARTSIFDEVYNEPSEVHKKTRQFNRADPVSKLQERIKALELENDNLRLQNGMTIPDKELPTITEPPAPTWATIYRVGHDSYLGQPEWVKDEHDELRVRGHLPLRDLDSYIDRHPEIAFIVFKYYKRKQDIEDESSQAAKADILQAPTPFEQSIYFTSDGMMEALRELIRNIPNFSTLCPKFDMGAEVDAPYLFMYHCNPMISDILPMLSPSQQGLIRLLRSCIEESHGKEYQEALEDFESGQVSQKTMVYLIKPGDILVGKKDSYIRAYKVVDCVKKGSRKSKSPFTWGRSNGADLQVQDSKSEDRATTAWMDFKCWSWLFDGKFEKKEKLITLYLKANDRDKKVKISSLNMYPIQFAGEEIEHVLKRRGRTFWDCRYRNFVSYLGDDQDPEALNPTSERFMIDNSTYKKLHGELKSSEKSSRDDMGAKAMENKDPPSDDTIYLFPLIINGYNMRLKKWVDLEVDRISEVQWNMKSFESLVMDDQSKELVQALITNQIAAEKSTDLIAGKGNGLIILLHGGPGTGKTFTAESVAEIAHKPLYRVTCGDIGMQPEAVEKYLESVLHLGKIWGCVVLLDEADVFLEERGLEDLQRNALVSVFLRVLEYYDGILILTSNRVGTFDEAFKSRIQLALHYENLTKTQRRKIWRNFMNRLKSLGESKVDYEDIDDHIDDLAEEDMNGRQIRNAITIGRKLAKYKEKDFNYAHLKHVIGVARKFDGYLKGVKQGLTDDQLARDEGLR